VRIGERHRGIVQTLGQPLLCRYGIVRGGLGPVDMELRRRQWRRYCDLHCVARDGKSDSDSDSDSDADADADTNANSYTRSC
jgi:hypothetical protein